MKRKSNIQSGFIACFVVLGILLFAANSVFAQCGTYFKSNYRVINKLNLQFGAVIYADDWTGDGKSDLWTFQRINTTFDVVIYPSKPTGYWDWDNPIIYSTTINLLDTAAPPIVLDFDSDGRKDMFYKNGNDLRLYRNTGNGALTASASALDPDTQTTGSLLGVMDVNSDNLLDWVYTVSFGNFPNTSYEIRYQLQNSNGSFSGKTTIHTSSVSSNKRLGDFNGDGRTDILYSGVLNNQHVYVLIKNLGSGTFQANAPVVADLYALSQPVYGNPVGDFNDDGRDDVLSRDAIFYGQADGTFIRTDISTPNDFLMPAELNGDNDLDFIEIGSTYYAAHINIGAGGFTRTEYPKNFKIIGNFKFEDFNGDGKDDLYIEPTDSTNVNKNIFGGGFWWSARIPVNRSAKLTSRILTAIRAPI